MIKKVVVVIFLFSYFYILLFVNIIRRSFNFFEEENYKNNDKPEKHKNIK